MCARHNNLDRVCVSLCTWSIMIRCKTSRFATISFDIHCFSKWRELYKLSKSQPRKRVVVVVVVVIVIDDDDIEQCVDQIN